MPAYRALTAAWDGARISSQPGNANWASEEIASFDWLPVIDAGERHPVATAWKIGPAPSCARTRSHQPNEILSEPPFSRNCSAWK